MAIRDALRYRLRLTGSVVPLLLLTAASYGLLLGTLIALPYAALLVAIPVVAGLIWLIRQLVHGLRRLLRWVSSIAGRRSRLGDGRPSRKPPEPTRDLANWLDLSWVMVALVWLTRQVTRGFRRFASDVIGVPIAEPYRPLEPGGARRKLLGLARDPASWRDLVWLALDSTLGFVAYTLVLSLSFGALWYLALPLLWWVLTEAGGPDLARQVLRTDFGAFAIDSQRAAFAGLPIAVLIGLLWWQFTPKILRGYARLSGTLLGPTDAAALAARVQQLTESRAETVDAQAAELRRIERDLHDGAQARLVALGMAVGMAEELIRTDPEAASRLLAQAREDTGRALAELRSLVRGMHPPVLADRGLSGAVQALAHAHPLPVEVIDELPGRLPAPVESAAYFAVSELLTNVSKHARASWAEVRLGYREGRLLVQVSDDGQGGAVRTDGGGLHGLTRRLSAFDGTVDLTSPAGGPTVVTLEIPSRLAAHT
ncbi:MAG TPA: sensor histidine kinase [Natronosporangium sp.]